MNVLATLAAETETTSFPVIIPVGLILALVTWPIRAAIRAWRNRRVYGGF